jgi:hypothetical protein
MPCPTLDQLEHLGKEWTAGMTQEAIDDECEVFL